MDAKEPNEVSFGDPLTFLIYGVECGWNELFLTVKADAGLPTEATRQRADG